MFPFVSQNEAAIILKLGNATNGHSHTPSLNFEQCGFWLWSCLENESLGNEQGDLLHKKLAISHLKALNVCLLLLFFNIRLEALLSKMNSVSVKN